jgi:cobalamin synthase
VEPEASLAYQVEPVASLAFPVVQVAFPVVLVACLVVLVACLVVLVVRQCFHRSFFGLLTLPQR